MESDGIWVTERFMKEDDGWRRRISHEMTNGGSVINQKRAARDGAMGEWLEDMR